ncbi:MAG: amino acid ABC transporter ATP-binding protein [Verrucomicrobia bacterium]|nr:amino acid ABC transporter ATP-binding protein [Verrucomicrobiota bacterium]
MALLSVQNLHKRFQDTHVLKGVSLEVQQGDLVSIIGPSGCGKSTLLRCMNFLETPDAGIVSVAGVSIDCHGIGDSLPPDLERKAHQLRQQIGLVFQQFHLFNHKTILENAVLAPMVVRSIRKSVARETGLQLLEKVGLGNLADRYPAQLSGGQQQRAAIARALAMKPKIMMYDEPTSALDPESVEEVLSVMKALDGEGMTQVVVTHEMRFAQDVSDHVIYMENGLIVETADKAQIFINPKDDRTRRFLRRYI